MQLIGVQRGMWVAALVAEVLLLSSLLIRGLARRYPFLFLYIAADLIWGLVLIQIDYRTVAYALGYRLYIGTVAVLRLGMGAELYERICEHFGGIGSFRLYMAGVLGALSALLTLATFWRGIAWGFPESLAIAIERFETAALFGVLLMTRFVLHHFLRVRPPMRPNVLNHWALLISYLGVGAASLAASQAVHPGIAVVWINIVMLGADSICLIIWAKALTAEGERVPWVREWSPEGEARKEELRQALLEMIERTVDDVFHRR